MQGKLSRRQGPPENSTNNNIQIDEITVDEEEEEIELWLAFLYSKIIIQLNLSS